MKLSRLTGSFGRVVLTPLVEVLCVGVVLPASVSAQPRKKNPVSKVYVSDVSGDAIIDTGDSIEDLSKRAVYTAQGTVIETKRPDNANERSKHFSTMVYSNGTGAFFDADTRVEVRRFIQEPFTPNRTDVETEPSISQTQAFVARGTVGLCTSKLVAGSNMTYQTPHGSVSIRGRKVVIQAENDVTKISMLEGDSTVRSGSTELGGHTLHAGEQAVIRRGSAGAPTRIEIRKIPNEEVPQLDDKVAMACMAKKTVYFEVRERQLTSSELEAAAAEGAEGDSTAGAPSGPVSAFDSAQTGSNSGFLRELVPIEIVPVNLPVEFTVSPARLLTPGNGPPAGSGPGN
jgi:hypothetical protein